MKQPVQNNNTLQSSKKNDTLKTSSKTSNNDNFQPFNGPPLFIYTNNGNVQPAKNNIHILQNNYYLETYSNNSNFQAQENNSQIPQYFLFDKTMAICNLIQLMTTFNHSMGIHSLNIKINDSLKHVKN